MLSADLLTIIYRWLGLKNPGTDTRSEVLEAVNSVLLAQAGGGLAHYKGWSVQEIPAPATLALTRTGANSFSYTGTSLSAAFPSRIVAGTYESRVIHVATATTTLTVERPVPAAFAAATSATQYCVGIDLSQATMPFLINGSLATGNMVPLACHTVQDTDGLDQEVFRPFDMSDDASTDLEWRYEAPFVLFRYPQSATAYVRILITRVPQLINPSSYAGTEVIDFPVQWERLLALKVAQVCKLLSTSPAMAELVEQQVRALEGSMNAQQLAGNFNRRDARDGAYGGLVIPARFVP